MTLLKLPTPVALAILHIWRLYEGGFGIQSQVDKLHDDWGITYNDVLIDNDMGCHVPGYLERDLSNL